MFKTPSIFTALIIASISATLAAELAMAQTVEDLQCRGCVNSQDLTNNAIKSKDIKNNTVRSKDIRDGHVTNEDLGSDAVTGDKILDESLTGFDLAPNSVGSSEIRDGAVTPSKLSNDALLTPSATASVGVLSSVDIPQTLPAVVLSLDPAGVNDNTSGLVEVPVDARLMATVAMRITPTLNSTTVQCRLFRHLEGGARSAMTSHIPRIPIPDGGVATSLVGASSVGPGTYDVRLECSAGGGGTAAPPLATLEEAQLIVWVGAQ